ncbi:MAG: hypothetical protein ACPGVD_02995, partial [Flavobacteriales bacterium]
MDKNNTYHPDDIEELLIQKEYNELSAEEREFVDSQIENATEYAELRNTLLTIKKIAQEEQAILVSPSIKEELLEKFENNKSKAGWFSLNSIGEFLFPSNTALFRKPGLQFALAGALLLLVVNIGLEQFSLTSSELAINTNKKELRKETETHTEETAEKENIDLVDKKEDETSNNGTLNKPESIEIKQIKIQPEKVQAPPAPASAPIIESTLDVMVEDDAIEEVHTIVAADENVTKGDENLKKVKRDDLSTDKLSLAKENQTLRYKDFNGSVDANSGFAKTVTGNISADTTTATTFNFTPQTNNAVSLNEVVVTEAKRKPNFKTVTVMGTSQSLAANEDVIDLLFVT